MVEETATAANTSQTNNVAVLTTVPGYELVPWKGPYCRGKFQAKKQGDGMPISIGQLNGDELGQGSRPGLRRCLELNMKLNGVYSVGI